MNTSYAVLLLVIAFLILLTILIVFRLTERPFRKIHQISYKEFGAHSAFLAGTAIMFAVSYLPAVQTIFEAVDMVYSSNSMAITPTNVKSTFAAGLTVGCILILIATSYFWFWKILGVYLTRPILGKANPVEEMEINNVGYFIGKHLLIILYMIVFLPFYMGALRHFLPVMDSPFYR